eukprot:gb/GECH01011111.1/.p1 GENE.gb/GECH01011111.1/~~gb/GECH01011111.1/.p1  ORF type:complete len:125 (+),score=27.58 gb/GECH01011111.1/:1-375(+)
MSWQTYVDNNLVGTGNVKQGALIGTDGSLWAASKGFNVPEGAQIAKAFNNPQEVFTNGLKVNGTKYIPLRADDAAIYAKQGKGGVTIAKTGQAIIIGVYDENIQPGNCNLTVENLADYLREQGL